MPDLGSAGENILRWRADSGFDPHSKVKAHVTTSQGFGKGKPG